VKERSCRTCHFSGMTPAKPDPHGPLKWLCLLSRGPLPPARICDQWTLDTGAPPTSGAILRAQRERRP
jgi:hypothetical protein